MGASDEHHGSFSRHRYPHQPLLTIRDVADLAGVSIMTVRRWISDHGLRTHRLGRLVRISQEDLGSFFTGKRNDDNSAG